MEPVQRSDLGITRRLWAFAVLSILLLGALAIAPARSYLSEWRAVQERYNAAAVAAGHAEVRVGLRQIWKPELGVVDRCPSCHLGMDGAEPVPGNRVFAAHSPVPHATRDLGCTVCHAGQGRATTEAAAHGNVPHWDEPLLPLRYTQAGCGTCHSHVHVASGALVDEGRKVVERSACRDCHRVNGAGEAKGPDLSTVGLKGFRPDWQEKHAQDARAHKGPWKGKSYQPLPKAEASAVDEFLRSLIGAPRLMAGKILAHELGCRGCHRIGGVGGDDGPDLSDIGRKRAADLDYAGVPGEHTLPNWLREHFLDPAKVVPGSQMPKLGLTGEQAELLTVYSLSLRAGPVPEALAPRDRVRGKRLGEREFATDGRSLFGTFCAGCHGVRGEGRQFGEPALFFPSVGHVDFLAVADDALIRRTILDGRPGMRMPAWGTKDGGLRPGEVESIVQYIRSLEPPPPPADAVFAAQPQPELGARLFAEDCSPCHGKAGEGSALAPPLSAPDNAITKDDRRIYETLVNGVSGSAMGRFRTYDPAMMRSVIAVVRALPPQGKREGWKSRTGKPKAGQARYAQHCASCHGSPGPGKGAPALRNKAFISAASEEYIAATIIRGRGTTMPRFGIPGKDHAQLTAEEVADIVGFLTAESWED
jgi:mono/diheme cytochrome c family protein